MISQAKPKAIPTLHHNIHLQLPRTLRHSRRPRRRDRRRRPNLSPRDLLLDETPQPRKRLQQRAGVVFPDVVAAGRDVDVRARTIEPRVLVVVLKEVVILPVRDAGKRIVGFFRRGADGRLEALDEKRRGICGAVGSVAAEGFRAGVRSLLRLLSLGGAPPRRAPLQHDALRFARDGGGVAGALGELVQH